MRALVLTSEGGLQLEDRPIPEPGEGEVLVEVLLAGICSTDLHLQAGYMAFEGVLGHEFVGLTADSEDLVVGEINAACRRCAACEQGLGRHCPDRTVLGILGRDGAFAEYLTLPEENLHRLPPMPIERAVFVEPVAAAFEILEQVGEVLGRRTLVLGAGKLGGLCAQVLQQAGADVTLVSRRSAQQPAGKYDLVVEATGSPEGFSAALGWVRPRGTLVLKSTCAGSQPLNLAPLVIDELTVIGSRCGLFGPAIDALGSGRLTPEQTIGGCFTLEQYAAAFEAAAAPVERSRRKILLKP